MAHVSQPDDDDAAALGLLRAHERAAAANDVQEADARQSERSKLQARLRARRDGAAATGRTLEPSERLDGGCPRIFVDDVGPPEHVCVRSTTRAFSPAPYAIFLPVRISL